MVSRHFRLVVFAYRLPVHNVFLCSFCCNPGRREGVDEISGAPDATRAHVEVDFQVRLAFYLIVVSMIVCDAADTRFLQKWALGFGVYYRCKSGNMSCV